MENSLPTSEGTRHSDGGRRRRSHKKPSKERYERNKRLKKLGMLLLIGAIGVVLVAGLSILAGGFGR